MLFGYETIRQRDAPVLPTHQPYAGVALVAHRIRRPLVFDREDRIARLQVRVAG